MRIGVDYRILTDPYALMGRGIGRYTQQQLSAVLKLDSENEYVLLCAPGSDPAGVVADVRDAPNVSIREVDVAGFGRVAEHDPAAASLLSRQVGTWLRRNGIDLYHATSPFVLDQPDLPQLDACPMVATVYDLIPYLLADSYLTDAGQRAAYLRAADFVSEAARIVAISESTAHDIAASWGYPADRIDVCPPFAGGHFARLSDDVRDAALRDLRKRVLLPQRYLVTVTALHPAKNLPWLLEAYALLPASLRLGLPLVICCHLEVSQADEVRARCDGLGIAGDVVLTGFVSDEELVAVYNGAELLVHPSCYEGFGLPVLEAMQCGTPVITSSTSSLPEVAGGAAALVDPGDASAMAGAIAALTDDPARRASMREAGLERAHAFTAEQLGRATLAAYRSAVSQPISPAVRVPPPVRGSVQVPPSPVPQATAVGDEGAFPDDVDGLRAQVERLDRAVANARERSRCAMARLSDAEDRNRRLQADLDHVRAREDAATQTLEELGPAALVVARRWRLLARRYPRTASAARAVIRRTARIAGRGGG